MSWLTRREFLQDSAALAGLLAGTGSMAFSEEAKAKTAKKGDANDVLHVAVIGVNGRGRAHIGSRRGGSGFAGKHGCVVDIICDVDEGVIGYAMKAAEEVQGKAPKYVKDLRRVMDDKSIDIVTIATPNHWHSLAAIWALQAGKDVYVEKPVSHNVHEGRILVETARKQHRLCQAGTQSRSSAAYKEAIAFLNEGKLGKLKVARGLCYKPRKSIGQVKGAGKIPATCDYNLWCGPAPDAPPHRTRFHYDWHWFWEYGNGDIGNQGIHEMDKARWGLGKNELPQAVTSVGGRFGYVDDGQTPNTQIAVFDYGDSELVFEVRGLPTKDLLGSKIGNIFHCTDGYLVMGLDARGSAPAIAFNLKGEKVKEFKGGGDHFANFVQAVRNRKADSLNADILEGHISTALCHLGNISYRLGKSTQFAEKSKAFGDDKEAYETLARMEEHLKADSVPVNNDTYRVGPRLAFNPKTESFVDNVKANSLLTRQYREPFVVPAKV